MWLPVNEITVQFLKNCSDVSELLELPNQVVVKQENQPYLCESVRCYLQLLGLRYSFETKYGLFVSQDINYLFIGTYSFRYKHDKYIYRNIHSGGLNCNPLSLRYSDTSF